MRQMKISSNFVNYFNLLFIIIYVNNGNDSSRTSGIRELINYIKVHSRKYQVCLLMGNDLNIKLNDILYEIEGNFPTRSINFNTMNDTKLPETFQGNTRRTTLFIVMAPSNFSPEMVDNLSTFFNQLSGMRMRQQCLIIISTIARELSVEEILLKMWTMAKMLDVTIFEMKQVVSSVNNRFISNTNLKTKVKHYNPFTNCYKEENISDVTEWFPDKLRDMHQFPVRVGFFEQFSSKVENETKTDSIDTINAPILKDFAKVLNFHVDVVLIDSDKINEFKDERIVYAYMEENEIDMIPDFFLYGNPVDYKFFEASRPVESIKVCAFVRIKTKTQLTLLIKQLLYMIVIFVILIIILSTLSLSLKLDHRFWNPITLIQIFLGNSLHHQPENLVDRIIFGSLILTHAVYSAKIFESLVNMGELTEFEMPLKSFEELNNSNLLPMMTNYTRNLIADNRDEIVLSLLNKSSLVEENMVCYRKLVSLENTTCIASINGSRMDTILSVRFLDKFGKPSIKALEFYLIEKWMFFSHKSGSPFTEKFDRLMVKLVDFGFYSKYMEFVLKYGYENDFQREKHFVKQEVYFYIVLIIGYCISLFVFVCEKFTKYRKLSD